MSSQSNVAMQEEEDYFGIQQVSRTAPPPQFISGEVSPKAKTADEIETNFIDATFFPSLATGEEAKQSRKVDGSARAKRKTKRDEEPRDDFFTESIKSIKKEGGFFVDSSADVSHREVESMLQKLKEPSESGLTAIQRLIDPVWRFSHEELLEFMEQRIVYQTEDVIAFDKPYQMAFAGASASQAQLNRLIKDLKQRLAPEAECFRPVTRLEKFSSGVVVFAKTMKKAKKLWKLIDEDHGLFAYRALVKNIPAEECNRINIALIKVEQGGDHKLCPLTGSARENQKLHHETTDVRVVNENREAHIALVDAFCKRSVANVVRSHLYYGLNCPVLGDRKYIKHEKEFKSTFAQLPRLSAAAAQALQLYKPNDVRQLPLFLHLAEVHIPENAEGRFSIIRAKMPAFFSYVLKRLRLLHK